MLCVYKSFGYKSDRIVFIGKSLKTFHAKSQIAQYPRAIGDFKKPRALAADGVIMDLPHHEQLFEEREFLKDIGQCLNKALFIIDRLTEELREEEGRLDDDPEIHRLFLHLNSHIQRVEGLIKDRHGHLSKVLDDELHPDKKLKKESSARNSPPRSP